ncbi:MAG: 3-dehydroquinate synthase [Pseudomonadota bacterium]
MPPQFLKVFATDMPTLVHSQLATPRGVKTIGVDLPGRAYDVLVGPGLIDNAGQTIAARLGRVKCGIVTDENVARHHLATLEASLSAQKMFKGSLTIRPGEASKSFGVLGPLCEDLLEMQLERGDVVVAFGGGVVGDLAGFASSILRRGVRLVQIPTSLLAQVDSSVGGKTGINTAQGKNLIGTFHQPSLVLADTDVLATLPPRELRAGYAEVVKYGLIGDAAFFEWLEGNADQLFNLSETSLILAIEASVKAKARVVIADEREGGVRALLNLGHTFGHALEAFTGYSQRLLHGEGVAIGMAMAFRLSERLNLCPPGVAERVSKHLTDCGLPVRACDMVAGDLPSVETMVDLMAQDKKVREGQLAFILVRDIGDAFVTRDVSSDVLKQFLADELVVR